MFSVVFRLLLFVVNPTLVVFVIVRHKYRCNTPFLEFLGFLGVSGGFGQYPAQSAEEARCKIPQALLLGIPLASKRMVPEPPSDAPTAHISSYPFVIRLHSGKLHLQIPHFEKYPSQHHVYEHSHFVWHSGHSWRKTPAMLGDGASRANCVCLVDFIPTIPPAKHWRGERPM